MPCALVVHVDQQMLTVDDADSSSASLPCLPTQAAPLLSARGARDTLRPLGVLIDTSFCAMCQAWESMWSSVER